VLGCLASAGLTHVSVGSSTLWTGYNAGTGTFVYVYLYGTEAAAAARARKLSDEEAGFAGRYLISQSIAPYHNSPVRPVTVCLGGTAPKNPPKRKGSFTF
jgi:hypothetical protein